MTIDADTLIKTMTLLFSVGTAAYAWIMAQGKAHEPKFKDLTDKLASAEQKLQAAEGRIAKLEGEMKHMPDQGAVHKLELGLKEVQSQMATHSEIVKRVERTMERVETFLDEQRRSAPVPARRGK